jgi:hypothetical protein
MFSQNEQKGFRGKMKDIIRSCGFRHRKEYHWLRENCRNDTNHERRIAT